MGKVAENDGGLAPSCSGVPDNNPEISFEKKTSCKILYCGSFLVRKCAAGGAVNCYYFSPLQQDGSSDVLRITLEVREISYT